MLLPQPDTTISVVAIPWGGVSWLGEPSSLLCCFAISVTVISAILTSGNPLCAPTQKPVTECTLCSGMKLILWDHFSSLQVVCSITRYQGQREESSWRLWATKLYGFVSLSGMLTGLQPLPHSSAVSWPGTWAQPQLVLFTLIGMLTKFLCSSWLSGVRATAQFLPFPGRASLWAFSCRTASVAPFSFLPFSPPCLHSHLPTFRCFDAHISQECLCIHYGIPCRVIAIQIVETSRGSLMLPFIYHCLYF